MQQSGDNQSAVKEMMQKLASKIEDKWDISKNAKFEDKWAINKNTKFEDKWDVNKNTKFEDEVRNKNIAATEQRARKGATDNARTEQERNAGKANSSEKLETGAVQSTEDGTKSSHRRSGNPTDDNPYVLAPIPTSQSGLEE